MKNYNKILTIAFVALLLVPSCKKLNENPVFEASESFAAFTQDVISVDENKGTLSIPVEIASIDPVKTTVSYKITDGKAKAGENFKDLNESAVLVFDGKTRSQNIELQIIDNAGEFTGDLDFSIELIAATGLKLSMEKTCKVTIVDLDHPLAAILGSYTVSCNDYWKKEQTYTMNLVKDPKDITVVWCEQIVLLSKTKAYANVTKDEETGAYTLSFPGGQVLAASYDDGEDLVLMIAEISGNQASLDKSSPIVFKQNTSASKVTFETEQGICAKTDSYFWQGGLFQGKTTWTKND